MINLNDAQKYAYLSKKAYEERLQFRGYRSRFLEAGDTQVHVLTGEDEILVVFRGTENIRDAVTDAKAWKRDARYLRGKVHAGFQEAFELIHNRLYEILVLNGARFQSEDEDEIHDSYRPVTFIGHSLGGALAMIAAAWNHAFDITAVVTFGAPRVFDKRAAAEYNLAATTYRF